MTSRSPEEWLGSARRVEVRLSGLEGEERWEYGEVILRELRLEEHLKDPALKKLMERGLQARLPDISSYGLRR